MRGAGSGVWSSSTNRVLIDNEKQMRLLRDARSQVEALGNYLAQVEAIDRYMKEQNNEYRAKMPDKRARVKKMVEEGLFRGRKAPEDVMRFYPGSYDRMRDALWS